MRKIRIIEHISLDGVIQAPGGPGEDGDYPYGGWTVPHGDTNAKLYPNNPNTTALRSNPSSLLPLKARRSRP